MLFAPYADDLAARLNVPRAAAVLEVACGTGILTKQLRRALPATATLTATDLNEPMLAHARARVPDAGITWQPAVPRRCVSPCGPWSASPVRLNKRWRRGAVEVE
jgi:trans-aconitate methyltransferase